MHYIRQTLLANIHLKNGDHKYVILVRHFSINEVMINILSSYIDVLELKLENSLKSWNIQK